MWLSGRTEEYTRPSIALTVCSVLHCRLVQRLPSLRLCINCLLAAVPHCLLLIVLALIALLVFGVLGMTLLRCAIGSQPYTPSVPLVCLATVARVDRTPMLVVAHAAIAVLSVA